MDNIHAIDPAKIQTMSKEELVLLHEQAAAVIDEMTAMQKVVRDELYIKIDMNGEIINNMQVSKAERINVATTVEQAEEFGAVTEEVDVEKITLDIARSLNATKRSVDVPMIRKLVKKGTVIPGISKVSFRIVSVFPPSSTRVYSVQPLSKLMSTCISAP